MRNLLLLCCLLLSFFAFSAEVMQPQPVRLLSREAASPLKIDLSDGDWRWLGEKREVTLAVYGPDRHPFSIIPEPGVYEGISADYSFLAMHYLGLRFQIRYFSSREDALAGLQKGLVDIVIDDGKGKTRPIAGLISSIPFIPDPPVLVSRETTMSKPVLLKPRARIAMIHGFVSDEWMARHYPDCQVTRYSSARGALSSVAFGENDYFIGNLASASYLIERNYSTMLSVAEVFSDDGAGPRFLLRNNDVVLQRSIDTVFRSISSEKRQLIAGHWIQGINLLLSPGQLPLTEREKTWLAKNQELRVVMNPLYAPFTVFDSQKQFQGIAADILRLIHLRTGLNFRAVEADTVSDMFKMVINQQGDFLAAMSYSPARDARLLFTRPYVQPSFVLVVRDSLLAPETLADMSRVAVAPGNTLAEWIKLQNPKITLVEAENASVAMKMVTDGKVDGAVNNLIGANYMIDRYFHGQLKIASRLGDKTSQIAFAVGRDQPELYSILNKALADIPASDISLIANKWQGTPVVKLDTWAVYRTQFYWLAGLFALLGITSLIWNYYLHREIRRRKDAQVRLQEQARFQETLFSGTPVPLYVVGPDGEIINRNPAWHRFFALSAEAHTLPVTSSLHPLAAVWPSLATLFQHQERSIFLQERYRINNGTGERYINHQAVAYRDNAGQVAGLICCLQDMTEHEQLLGDVLHSRELAEQANRSKSTFLATMSHEIRTPISAIIGLLELAITNKKPHGESEESVRVAYESAQSLMGLIGDILDMAKIESGKLELSPEWVPFDSLVSPVTRVFDGLARQKGLLLQSYVDVLHPDEILIDPGRVRQVLSNLVSNAIKFTEHGSVSVQLQCTPNDDNKIMLEFTVTDTGVGIAQEEQPDVFNPYVQSESGRKQNGTGLGLAICHQLVTMMSGNILLNSHPGRGTRVTVQIPVCHREMKPGDVDTVEETTEDIQPLNILAVDDHPANRMLLRQQLLRLGHHVSEAENGEEALQLSRSDTFDLVITDCSMPVMDGLELTQRLREEQGHKLTILGLTANAQPEERTRCLAVGMDDCLYKPLRLAQLEGLLRRIPRQVTITPALDKIVDLNALKELAQNDDMLLNGLLKTTLDENLRDLEQATRWLNEENWEALARSVHRLAGAAQIIGATVAEQHCRTLEHICEHEPENTETGMYFNTAMNAIQELNRAIELWIASTDI